VPTGPRRRPACGCRVSRCQKINIAGWPMPSPTPSQPSSSSLAGHTGQRRPVLWWTLAEPLPLRAPLPPYERDPSHARGVVVGRGVNHSRRERLRDVLGHRRVLQSGTASSSTRYLRYNPHQPTLPPRASSSALGPLLPRAWVRHQAGRRWPAISNWADPALTSMMTVHRVCVRKTARMSARG
jgi:hypothetical protein